MSELSPSKERLLLSGGAATPAFFEAVFAFAEVDQPRIVIDSTAVANSNGKNTLDTILGRLLERGAEVEIIGRPEASEDEEVSDSSTILLKEADILFVTGGDTKKLLDGWHETGRDNLVSSLLHAGKLTVCGASAGALIWFNTAFSDYRQYRTQPGRPWDYAQLSGLGLLPSWGNVHHSDRDNIGRPRKYYFETRTASDKEFRPAIGLDSYAALRISQGQVSPVDLRNEQTRSDATGSVHYYANGSKKSHQTLGRDRVLSLNTLALVEPPDTIRL